MENISLLIWLVFAALAVLLGRKLKDKSKDEQIRRDKNQTNKVLDFRNNRSNSYIDKKKIDYKGINMYLDESYKTNIENDLKIFFNDKSYMIFQISEYKTKTNNIDILTANQYFTTVYSMMTKHPKYNKMKLDKGPYEVKFNNSKGWIASFKTNTDKIESFYLIYNFTPIYINFHSQAEDYKKYFTEVIEILNSIE